MYSSLSHFTLPNLRNQVHYKNRDAFTIMSPRINWIREQDFEDHHKRTEGKLNAEPLNCYSVEAWYVYLSPWYLCSFSSYSRHIPSQRRAVYRENVAVPGVN
jgi:hypothetical protein